MICVSFVWLCVFLSVSSVRRSDPAAPAGRPGGDTCWPRWHPQSVLWRVHLRQGESAAQGSQEQVGTTAHKGYGDSSVLHIPVALAPPPLSVDQPLQGVGKLFDHRRFVILQIQGLSSVDNGLNHHCVTAFVDSDLRDIYLSLRF